MIYQPKTDAEQRILLDQWKVWARNNVSDAVTSTLDDLASCEAALAETQKDLYARNRQIDRYEKALARIAELEQMVRELVEAVDQCFGNVAISMDDEIVWANTRRKALALLQPEKRR